MKWEWIRRLATPILSILIVLSFTGCDEYEREQLRQAGDDINAAGDHIGNASGSAVDRARSGTGEALRNLGNKIDAHNQKIEDAADQATD